MDGGVRLSRGYGYETKGRQGDMKFVGAFIL
jgi:hypothetical protein